MHVTNLVISSSPETLSDGPSPGAQGTTTIGKAPKVAIPRQASTGGPTTGGPTSQAYTIPPRPKPGRKPLEADTDNKRKLQNRFAQRNFRDRRARKVQDLEELIAELRAEKDAEIARLNNKVQQQQVQLDERQSQAEHWKEQAQQLEQLLDQERKHAESLLRRPVNSYEDASSSSQAASSASQQRVSSQQSLSGTEWSNSPY